MSPVKHTEPVLSSDIAPQSARMGGSPQPGKRAYLRWGIGLTILAVFAIAYGSYRSARNLLLENLRTAALIKVQEGVDKVDKWLAVRKVEVSTLANSPALRSMDSTIALPYLESEVDRLEYFYHFGYVYPNGEYYVTNKGKADANLSDRPHIKQALLGNIFVSDPVISRSQGIPVVIVVAPIWAGVANASDIVGINTGVVDIDELSAVVNRLDDDYGDNSYAFALNSAGAAIVHPDESRIGTRENPAPSFLEDEDLELQRIAQSMVEQSNSANPQPAIDSAVLDGKDVYVAKVPLTEANWSVALVIPRGEIDNQLRPLDLLVLTILGLVIALTLLLWRFQNFEKTQLQQAKQAADAASKAKSDFLSTMSHELRTPLHAIIGFSRLLSENEAITTGKKELNIIRRSGDHLLELINDILTMSKIEVGNINLNNYSFDLLELLTNLQDMLELRADAKDLNLSFELAEGIPQFIEADSKKLRQVLLNLLGNAIKFTDQGSIILQVSPCCQINTYFQQPKTQAPSDEMFVNGLAFQVVDTGLGIAPEELALLFRPFSQTQAGMKSQEGTGLGLAISQRLVQLMGGSLEASSTLDQGSVFSFTIDCTTVDAKQVIAKTTPQSVKGLVSGQPEYRILVADDQPINRDLVRQIMEPVGFTVKAAKNGQEAVSIWQQWQPHLIWMDMRMPVMNGKEATQAIRSAEAQQAEDQQVELQEAGFQTTEPQETQQNRTIIVALTASGLMEHRNDMINAGCDDVVNKPFVPETLFRIVAQHLGVNYIYAETPKVLESSAAIRDLRPEQLPDGWLQNLYQLAYEADDQGIRTLLEMLPADHIDWNLTISKWVDDFRFEAIMELVTSLDPEHGQ
ncbi:MAG: ATP-binding protein [Leptolyngbyaceae cyanobacterium]